jgi:hypothetical protein
MLAWSESSYQRPLALVGQWRWCMELNYGVDRKKIPSPVKPGFRGFLSREKISSS